MSVYVQFGACAGDQDPRLNFRDGFTEYVKAKNNEEISLILLVEANPRNIPALTKCWEKYDQARIYNTAIRTSDMPAGLVNFYYAEEDGPHYQISSLNKNHVLGHYPNTSILQHTVPTLDVNSILSGAGPDIEMLGIDVETMDAKIVFDIQFDKYNIKNISFEFTSIPVQTLIPLMRHLESNGYTFIGKGLDHNGEDFMYTKTRM